MARLRVKLTVNSKLTVNWGSGLRRRFLKTVLESDLDGWNRYSEIEYEAIKNVAFLHVGKRRFLVAA